MKYIITGTSSGLGFQLCSKLLEHGDVIGLSRSLGKTERFMDDSRFTHISCDFSESSLFEKGSSLFCDLFESLGCHEFTLIVNAAAFYSGDQRLSPSMLSNMFSVNVTSPIKLINGLQHLPLKRILFVNSISGLIGQQYEHEYSSTKHALMGFAKSLAKSAKNSCFDVMTINPGGMKTELWNNYHNVNSNDFLDPSLIADLCVSLVLLPGRVFIENLVILPPSDVC